MVGPIGPIARVLVQVGTVVGGAVFRAAYDAYKIEAARNGGGGGFASSSVFGRQTQPMSRDEALRILNVEAARKDQLSPQDYQKAEQNYRKYFNDNAPDETGGPGGSAYLQGKIIAAYKLLEEEQKKKDKP